MVTIAHVGSKIIGTPTLGLRGLVLWLKFNEGSGNIAYDSSFYNNHGTIYGAVYTDGKFGKALSFDGVDDYVEVPAFQIGTNKISIIAWAKYANDAPDWSPIIAQRVIAGQITTMMVNSEGKPRFEVMGEDVTESLYFHGTTHVRDNEWHFWAMTYDGHTLKGWIDLVYQGSREGAVGKIKVVREWYVGWDYDWANRYMKGLIDEVRIYNRALSEEEIRMLYYQRLGAVLSKEITS